MAYRNDLMRQINFFTLLTILLPCIFAEQPPYKPRGFRPSQPFPLPDRIKTQNPAQQYGPPKPVYGVPAKPDETTEPTTPPNNFKNTPSKFDSQNLQNLAQLQSLPFKNPSNFNSPFRQQLNSQLSNKQNDYFSQLRLPEFGQKFFKPQQNIQTANLQGQALPNPVPAYIFDDQKSSAQLNNPGNFHVFDKSNKRGNSNVEIQQSQQLPSKQFSNPSVPSNNDLNNDNYNFNNQNSINLQTSSLPGLIGIPIQKPIKNGAQISRQSNKLSKANAESEVSSKHQFLNDEVLAAKRSSSPRRGGKATAAPERQYLRPVPTTVKPSVSATVRRRRPTSTEQSETEVVPVTRRPNVSIANAFAGRLFLLQPDGRLEPVILRRANPNGFENSDAGNISPAELMQPFYSSIPLLANN